MPLTQADMTTVSKVVTNTIEKELEKALSGRARSAGMSPYELFNRDTAGGAVSGTYDPDGRFHPFQGNARFGMTGRMKSFWKDGKEHGFNDYLKAVYHHAVDGNEQAHKQLEGYGVQKIWQQGDTVYKTALAESSGITGGYTVPPQFHTQLQMLSVEDTFVEPRCTKMPMTTRTLTIPSLDQTTNNAPGAAGTGRSNLLGGVVAQWTSEAAPRAETEPQFRSTTLTAWELSFITVASNTLLQDEAVGLDALLTQLFATAMGWHTEYAFLQGNGVGKPLGILNAPATVTASRAATGYFRFLDVGSMLSKLYWMLRGSKSLCWAIHPSMIPYLYTLNDTSGSQTAQGYGRVLFVPINEGAQEKIPESAGVHSFGYLAGYPVIVTEKLPSLGNTGDVILCDWSKYLVGKRMEIEIAVSPHVAFTTNQLVWRVIVRVDGEPWLNNPVTLADGSYTVSPFIALHS